MYTIFTATDLEGNQIVLDDDAWAHIVENHPDMTTYQPAVRSTLEQPEIITARPGLARYYYARGAAPTRPEQHFVVVVVRTNRHPYRVMTAHLCSRIEGETIIWTRIESNP